MTYTTNVIETNQSDGSVKVVLGSIVQSTRPRLSKSILPLDEMVLIALAEEYGTPCLLEFFGRHIYEIMEHGLKGRSVTKKERGLFEKYKKVGIALIAASIAVEALSAGLPDSTMEDAENAAPPASKPASGADFVKKMKEIEEALKEK